MYLDNDCDNDSLSAIKCLSLKGWLITIGSTYLGFFFLVIGSFWNANIMEKVVYCSVVQLGTSNH